MVTQKQGIYKVINITQIWARERLHTATDAELIAANSTLYPRTQAQAFNKLSWKEKEMHMKAELDPGAVSFTNDRLMVGFTFL